jgi:hypothetical protein
MAKQRIDLWRTFEESSSGHTDSLDEGYLESEGETILLVDHSSYTNHYKVAERSDTTKTYSVSKVELCKWIKANGKELKK